MGYMPTQTDYGAEIRAQIERDVLTLKKLVENPARFGDCDAPVSPLVADYVEIGYLVNTHRGQALYETGDTIHGLPVTITTETGTIRVGKRNVSFRRVLQVFVEGEGYVDTDEAQEYDEDVEEMTTWN